MELALLVYGISVLSGITVILAITIFLCGLAIVSTLIGFENNRWKYKDDDSEYWNKTKTDVWKYVRVIAVLSVLCALIPSKQTSYIMVGAYAAQKVVEAPETKVLSGKVIKVIEKQLDEYIQEPVTKK